jgi:leucyl-tRNA synthetase
MKKPLEYNHLKIEKKWQSFWDKKKLYEVKEKGKGKTFYGLIEFPYPSGSGLHVGHIRSNTAMDIISRKRRMEGYNVLYPIGWDAFGLPTEQYAIKTGVNPVIVTKKNTDIFRKQLKALGFSFDWSREINTTDPQYYKWTQWIFLQMYKKGLAYKAKTTINWCPKDKIGLANEEVVDGKCERCGTTTVKKEKEQWMLAITKYADRLDKDLDDVDFLEKIKIQQRNWIGKSEGSEIDFQITSAGSNLAECVKVFTTRADTLFGVTYIVLSPEHHLISSLKSQISNWDEVEKYINSVKDKTDIERTGEDKDISTSSVQVKTGVELKGIKAINPAYDGASPANNEEISVWIADYVLASYGTGAVMAVPAHDERDFAFAKKYNLPIKQVIMPENVNADKNPPRSGKKDTERNVVHIILRDKKNNSVLLAHLKGEVWGDNKPINFIIGGIEEGESEIETAIREIKEETGYTDVSFVEKIPFDVQAKFFQAQKDVNRTVHVRTLVFDLLSEKKVPVDEEEKDKHDFVWVPENKVTDLLNIPDDILTWKYYQKGGFAFTDDGVLINSGSFSKLNSKEANKKITEFVGGKIVTKYKLRDWVFSRQRYWGEPIPLIFCDNCKKQAEIKNDVTNSGWIPVPEKDLPVILPKVKKYEPTDNGESPLSAISKWVNTKCPNCKGPARRETDTMPNWAGSSWYFLRYIDPKNKKTFAGKNKLKYWGNSSSKIKAGPVDWYNGGMEHTTLHLLYSRFWHKFLYDINMVPTPEPYIKRTSHGMILASGGEKMSKSKGNTVNPDDVVKNFGADTLRLYEMFMGPFDQAVAWSTDSIVGPRRFIEKLWRLQYRISNTKSKLKNDSDLDIFIHKTIKKVGEDIESMSFNTAVSACMILLNEFEKREFIKKDDFKLFLQILAPFIPHVTEELWQSVGETKSIHLSSWPKFNPDKIISDKVTIAVQINGKVRAEISIEKEASEESVKSLVLSLPEILKYLEGKEIIRFIYVKGRIANLLISQ